MNRQHTIREYELFVSNGVQEIPEAVFEREPRAFGEYREVRVTHPSVIAHDEEYQGIVLGTAMIDLESGEILELSQ